MSKKILVIILLSFLIITGLVYLLLKTSLIFKNPQWQKDFSSDLTPTIFTPTTFSTSIQPTQTNPKNPTPFPRQLRTKDGGYYATGQIIISVNKGVSEERIKEIVSLENTRILRISSFYLVAVEPGKEEDMVLRFKNYPEIKSAELDGIVTSNN